MTHLLKYVQPNEPLVYSEYITLELLSISFADVWRCNTWHGRSESHEFHPCMIYLAAMRQAKRRQHLPLWRTRTSASRTNRHKQRAIRYVTSHGRSSRLFRVGLWPMANIMSYRLGSASLCTLLRSIGHVTTGGSTAVRFDRLSSNHLEITRHAARCSPLEC